MFSSALVLALALFPTAQAGILIGEGGAPGIGDPAAYVDEWGQIYEVDGDDGAVVAQVTEWGRAVAVHLGPAGLLLPDVAPLVVETEAGAFLTVAPKSGGLVPVDWGEITINPLAGTDVGNPATDPLAGTDVGNPATDPLAGTDVGNPAPTFPLISPYDYQQGDEMLLIPIPNPLVEPRTCVIGYQNGDDPLTWPVSGTLSLDKPAVDAKTFTGVAAELMAGDGLLWGILDFQLPGRVLALDGWYWYINEYGLVFEVHAKTGELSWAPQMGFVQGYELGKDGTVVVWNHLGEKYVLQAIDAPDVVG
jgi:hypothetical protein